MKVLTLTTLFPNRLQPISNIFVKNRVTALARHTDLRVVAPVPWAPLDVGEYGVYRRIPSYEVQGSIEVFHPRYLVTPKVGRFLYGYMYYFSLKKFLKDMTQKDRFDILDVHWAYPDGFAGVKLAKELGIPVSLTVRGSDINIYTRYPLRRKLIAYALRKADLVIAVCGDMARKVESLGVSKDKVRVIPNGVDVRRFYPMERVSARDKLGLPQDRKIILSVGRLEPPKRFDLLIRALEEIVCHDSNILLIIVGEGSKRSRLERLSRDLRVSEWVQFVGAKPNEELVYWYNAADVFCLSSDSEGWPNVLFESLACGTPVVASNVGGVSEVIPSDDYGVLINGDERDLWCRGILEALNRDWDRRKLSEYARGNTWDEVGWRVYSEFRSLLQRRVGR